jgi:hypothetical protein
MTDSDKQVAVRLFLCGCVWPLFWLCLLLLFVELHQEKKERNT